MNGVSGWCSHAQALRLPGKSPLSLTKPEG